MGTSIDVLSSRGDDCNYIYMHIEQYSGRSQSIFRETKSPKFNPVDLYATGASQNCLGYI